MNQDYVSVIDFSANGPSRGMFDPPTDANGNIILPRKPKRIYKPVAAKSTGKSGVKLTTDPEEVASLKKRGMTFVEIGLHLGISHSSAYNLWRRA